MDQQSAQVLQSNPSFLTWVHTLELGYELSPNRSRALKECFCCQKGSTQETTEAASEKKALRCARCRVATYCGRECQVKDWKAGHKLCCESLKRAGSQLDFGAKATADADTSVVVEGKKAEARRDIFQRVRFYACAYAVHQARALGRGFLFVQSDQSLAAMSLTLPLHCDKRKRSLLLHYLTLGEYDAEVCRDDFELAAIRSQLKSTISEYDESGQVVLLMRFRCGHVALGVATLVPDHAICRKLGMDYFGDTNPPSLQLNIDDT